MNRDKARELLEKELRIRPTVKASAIFTGKRERLELYLKREAEMLSGGVQSLSLIHI